MPMDLAEAAAEGNRWMAWAQAPAAHAVGAYVDVARVIHAGKLEPAVRVVFAHAAGVHVHYFPAEQAASLAEQIADRAREAASGLIVAQNGNGHAGT